MAARRNCAPGPRPRFLILCAALAVAVALACGGDSSAPRESPLPGGPGPAADATIPADILDHPTLADAAAYRFEGRYEDAITLYQGVLDDADNDTLRAEALLGIAVTRFDLGDNEDAMDALRDAADTAPADSNVAARVAYLLGLRLADAGEYEDAADTLRPFVEAGAGGPLLPYLQSEFAAASLRAGDASAANATWDALLGTEGLPVGIRASALASRADAHAAEDNFPAARAALEEHVALTGDPGQRFLLAEYARASGDTDVFANELRRVIAETPGSRFALLAIDELRRAGEAIDGGDEGYVYYRHRDYEQARATLEAAIDEPGITPAQIAFRTYYLAASYEDDGMPAEAIPLYDAAAAIGEGTPYAHRARYWAAGSAETLGEVDDASRRYRELATSGPPGEFTAEATFRSGYVWYESGDPAAATAAWANSPTPAEPRLAYWRGRAFQATGDNTTAAAAYEEAATASPRSFYGIEAARALGQPVDDGTAYEPLPALTPIDWDATASWLNAITPGELPSADSAGTAASLAAIGLRSEASAAVDAIAAPGDTWAHLAATREAYEAGLTAPAIGHARRVQLATGIPDAELPRDLLRVLYPLRYVALLEAAGSSYGLDPLLLAAVIYQESRWSPQAVSFADARGLMQVIPGTGDGIAAQLDLETFATTDLFRPATAITFGAHYLAAQLESFESLHPALAAYNAGPGNAARWVADDQPPANFVTAVQFLETRAYVPSVIEHLAWYRFVYRDAG